MSDHQFAFLSQGGFVGAPKPSNQKFCAAGVAFDSATTNRPGARFGPRQIRSASMMLCDATHPHFDTTPHGHLADAGDLLLPNTSLADMRKALEPQAAALIAKHHMVWLGGDHSITLSLLRAYKQVMGKPLAVIHFDAHCDTWSDHFGEPSGHGTWVYEAVQEGLVVPQAFVQLGIRSAGERAAREYINTVGGRVFTARELRGLDNTSRCTRVREPRHRLPRPRFRPWHRYTGTRRPFYQSGTHRAGRTLRRPAQFCWHGLRGSCAAV
jgi:agmatinase